MEHIDFFSSEASHSLGGLLHMVRNILQKKTKQALRKLDLTPLEGFELYYVVKAEDDGGVSQSVIRELLSISAPAVLKMTMELEQRGLLFRKDNPYDKRSQLLYPTEEGKNLSKAFTQIIDMEEERLFAACTEREISELTRILRKLADSNS